MPQLDKEIFVEYFFLILLILIQLFSNETISENFLKANTRLFFYNFLILKKNLFNNEIKLIKQVYKIEK
uniref:ATP synthase F0 subunit 8 n=1 Tax=Cafileria marina TaxID=2557541 RepID=A0A5B9IL09_9STRA|nr:ATP synthase F0 subunit 8 [Cafileria marina]QEF30271.1 ATP synthase F0 subunit 8 [Cafileria marina]